MATATVKPQSKRGSRYCPKGHDKWEVGRSSSGGCRVCAAMHKGQIRSQKRGALEQAAYELGCRRCGTKDGRLEWHHRNPAEKSFPVSDVDRSWQTLGPEVEKCDVLCRACHQYEHRSRGAKVHMQRGWRVTFCTTDEAEADRILALIREATA